MNIDEKTLQIKNVMLFFIRICEELGPFNRNPKFLNFFREMCKFDDKGVSVNQELLFKFIFQRSKLLISLLVPISIKNNKLFFEYHKGIVKILENYKFYWETIKDSNVIYLVEQLKLLSDLALSRNYLWNSVIE